MGRLKSVDPASAQGRVKEIFDGPLKGKYINIFKAMANSPVGLDLYLAMAGALGKSSLTEAQREVVQLAIGAANSCDYCQAAHTVIGKGAGLSEQQTVQARRGSVQGDPKLDALAKFALAIHEKKGFVSDDDLSKFKSAGFGDGEVVEVVATYALAIYTNTFNHVNQTEVDFPTPPAL